MHELDYYVTAKYVLAITNQAYDHLAGSEVEQKRVLIKFLLSNLRLDGKKIAYDVAKPFNLILEMGDHQLWCALSDYLRNFIDDIGLIFAIRSLLPNSFPLGA